MITEQEKQDLEVLKQEVAKIKLNAYDLLRIMAGANDLSIYGYSTLGDATKGVIKDTDKQVKKLIDAHVKKYPD